MQWPKPCFERSNLLKVMYRRRSAPPVLKPAGYDDSVGTRPPFFEVHPRHSRSRAGSGPLLAGSRDPSLATSVLTATTQLDAIGAGITAGAGTGLVLQLLLGGVSKSPPLRLPSVKPGIVIFRHVLRGYPIGNVARLLPSLEVGAVSQATSPGPNPDPLYPLRVRPYSTRSTMHDRSETLRRRQALRPGQLQGIAPD